MQWYWKVILIIVGSLLLMYFVRKIIESIINLRFISKDKNLHNPIYQKQGIILNKSTKKLEADNSIILPFK